MYCIFGSHWPERPASCTSLEPGPWSMELQTLLCLSPSASPKLTSGDLLDIHPIMAYTMGAHTEVTRDRLSRPACASPASCWTPEQGLGLGSPPSFPVRTSFALALDFLWGIHPLVSLFGGPSFPSRVRLLHPALGRAACTGRARPLRICMCRKIMSNHARHIFSTLGHASKRCHHVMSIRCHVSRNAKLACPDRHDPHAALPTSPGPGQGDMGCDPACPLILPSSSWRQEARQLASPPGYLPRTLALRQSLTGFSNCRAPTALPGPSPSLIPGGPI